MSTNEPVPYVFFVIPVSKHACPREEPFELGRREVRIEHEPGALAYERLVTRGAQLVAAAGRAAVLPDDRPVQRTAGATVPDHGRLTLVRDADRRNREPVGLELRPHLGERLRGRRPDLLGLVLDPAGLREVLGELAVRPPDGPARVVDRVRPHAGRAGVDREADAHSAITRRRVGAAVGPSRA